MIKSHRTKQFKKDYKREQKRKSDLTKLQEAMSLLLAGEQLDPQYKAHPLRGNWEPAWECHIGGDLLLIWKAPTSDSITFERIGTHSDLFKE